ncbi:MAG: FAD-dependent oxidoreductase [Anaerolineales bacterium]|nr:FAD-dependent oxidoreductase [Anaerolineales bacterium]
MEKFDAIVVGAGPAGSTAAYLLAQAGLNVVIIDRGQTPGSKNVSGGLVYSKILQQVFPEFWQDAPVERAITSHEIVMLAEDSATGMSHRSNSAAAPPYNAFSVLRAKFDPWLAQKAEDAGAMLINAVTVDELILEEGRVVGIRAGEDELMADVVVVADGTRSLLLKSACLRPDFHPHDVSIGVKEVISLPPDVITERFLSSPETGAAYTLVGSTGGIEGGGFVYTNKASLSIGVVVKIDSLYESKRQPHEVLDQFKSHPFVARLIKDGEVVEYSAQTVHRGGFHLMGQLYGDGYVVIGSAARLLINNMFTLRGMDLAVASAAAAAEAIIIAKEQNEDFSSASLARYADLFQADWVYQNYKEFKDAYPIMENKRLFTVYPELVAAVMEDLFGVDQREGRKILASLRSNMKGKVTMGVLLKDLYQIARGLVL